MQERIEKIKNDVKTKIFNQNDELTIIGLRIIELLEELKGEKENAGRKSEPKRESKPRRKPEPKRKRFSPRPGWIDPKLAGSIAAGTEVREDTRKI